MHQLHWKTKIKEPSAPILKRAPIRVYQTKMVVSDKWMISVCFSWLSEDAVHMNLHSTKISSPVFIIFHSKHCTGTPQTWLHNHAFAELWHVYLMLNFFCFSHVSTTSTLSGPPALQPKCQPGKAISVRTSWTLAICQSANASFLLAGNVQKWEVILCTCKSQISKAIAWKWIC